MTTTLEPLAIGLDSELPTVQPVKHIPVRPQHPVLNPCAGCPRWRGNPSRLIISPHKPDVYWDGKPVGLTVNEGRVLYMMVMARGEYVAYRLLYDRLRDYPGFIAGSGEDGFKSNMRSCIKRIRRKFAAIDPEFDAIHNRMGFGYAWKE